MAKGGHKRAFQGQQEIRAFLTERWPTPSDLTQALALKGVAVSPETVKNWYRQTANDMSAVSLLRVIIALGAGDEFAEWLEGLHLDDVTRQAADAGRERRDSAKGK